MSSGFEKWTVERDDGHTLTESTTLKVPSDYADDKSASIDLYVKRFRFPKENVQLEAHLILLAEDPGNPAAESDLCKGFAPNYPASVSGKVITYTLDYRGTGKSGAYPYLDSWDSVAASLKSVMEGALPFRPKDLTAENTAKDLNSLITAIKSSPDWNPAYMRIICVAAAYGTLVVNEAINLAPDAIDYAVFHGLDWTMAEPSLEGMLEDCAKNPKCIRVMGPNVKRSFRKMIKTILQDDENECIASLNQLLKIPIKGENKLLGLNFFFSTLLNSDAKLDFKDPIYLHELLLPIVKAMAECSSGKAAFLSEVIHPLQNFFADKLNFPLKGAIPPPSRRNVLVQTIVRYWMNYEMKKNDPLDIHPFELEITLDRHRFEILKTFLVEQVPSRGIRPAASNTTQIVLFQSMIDMKAGFNRAYDYFLQLKVPGKVWKLHREVANYNGHCAVQAISSFIYNSKKNLDFKNCAIASAPYTWNFIDISYIQNNIWKPPNLPVTSTVIHYEDIPALEGEIKYKVPKLKQMQGDKDDYEEDLNKIGPRVNWVLCSEGPCSIGPDTASYRGTMEVPSDYSDPVASPKFSMGVQKFTSHPMANVRHHIIFLAGGPGGYGRTYDSLIKALLMDNQLQIACYTIDHRGLGGSGQFYKADDKNFYENMGNILKNPPFPLKDLTFHNAALDVGMLALALKNFADYTGDSTISLFGFSYGSLLAHQTVARIPNLFNNAIYGGLPRLEGTRLDGVLGLYEHCEKDAFCRNAVGGNVRATMREAIFRIIHPETNKCTEIFHKSLTQPLDGVDDDERVSKLAELFYGLTLGHSENFPSLPDILSSQLLIPFIKATSDCTDLKAYSAKVLAPFSKYIAASGPKDAISGIDINYFVNAVILMDTEPFPHVDTSTLLKNIEDNLHWEEASFPDNFYHMQQKLYPWLWQKQKSIIKPIKTKKTKLTLLSSWMDLVTPFYPAWEKFQDDQSPRKRWMLFHNEGHNVYLGRCLYRLFLEVCDFREAGGSTHQDCIAEANAQHRLDWKFQSIPEMAKMWELVKDYDKAGNGRIPLKLMTPEVPQFYEAFMTDIKQGKVVAEKKENKSSLEPKMITKDLNQEVVNPSFDEIEKEKEKEKKKLLDVNKVVTSSDQVKEPKDTDEKVVTKGLPSKPNIDAKTVTKGLPSRPTTDYKETPKVADKEIAKVSSVSDIDSTGSGSLKHSSSKTAGKTSGSQGSSHGSLVTTSSSSSDRGGGSSGSGSGGSGSGKGSGSSSTPKMSTPAVQKPKVQPSSLVAPLPSVAAAAKGSKKKDNSAYTVQSSSLLTFLPLLLIISLMLKDHLRL